MALTSILSGAALALTAIGTGASVVGQISSGISQKRQAEYNQKMAEYNAASTRQMAEYNAELERRQAAATRAAGVMEANKRGAEGKRLLSTQQAMFDAAGVDSASGSPLTVMADTAANIERDILTTKYNYEVKALGYDSQADLWGFKGRQEENIWKMKARQEARRGDSALWGGLLGGAMEAFKGASNIFSSYSFGKSGTSKVGLIGYGTEG